MFFKSKQAFLSRSYFRVEKAHQLREVNRKQFEAISQVPSEIERSAEDGKTAIFTRKNRDLRKVQIKRNSLSEQNWSSWEDSRS